MNIIKSKQEKKGPKTPRMMRMIFSVNNIF
jgi:hypothetical protein